MRDKNVIVYTNEIDPFNPKNRMTCDMCTESGPNYGSLRIRKINNKSAPQPTINGTPKLYYPFNKVHKYQFPSATEIRSYDKIDGTNVVAYRYLDSTGHPFITFKVRLFPFLRGQFVPMWQRILNMYPNLSKLFVMNPSVSAFSFELFGSDNIHLIKYPEKLDIRLLFGIKRGWTDGEPIYAIPEEINTGGMVATAFHQQTITSDYVWNYEQEQKAKDSILTPVDNDEDDRQIFEGSEGSVWYLREKESGNWRMFKCKPHQIEVIHWASEHIPSTICHATAHNVLETQDDVTYESVVELLLEDYTQEKIDKSAYRIRKAVNTMQEAIFLHQQVDIVMNLYDFSDADVPTVMRTLSKHFDRGDMRKVFQRVDKIRKGEV